MTNGIGVGKPKRLHELVMSAKRHDNVHFEETEYLEADPHSPTDSSEDSVEVKVFPISPRNKRKCSEPRRVPETPFAPPLKKRIRYQIKTEIPDELPFRPWSNPDVKSEPDFTEPLPLLKKECKVEPVVEMRVPPVHPHLDGLADSETLMMSSAAFPGLQYEQRKEARNYKNMTRERRIEANARERTRVHTISAAFETLRKSVPAYSHNQKLSKLSVLRIACSYIMTLSTLLGNEGGGPSALAECVENVSKTIQKEGKLRKKKDESD